jgi:peptidoglycan/xylan/chitin deacetylase (PgdA/CDA1 family)
MSPFILILNYHRVGLPSSEARYRRMFVTPFHLHMQVHMLKWLGFEILPLCEAWESHAPRVACLTFDDGYLDNLTAGLSVLHREGIRATIFAVTDDVGKAQHRWEEAGETARADLLSWTQLQMLQEKGWEIGSHAHEHRHLSRLPFDLQKQLLTVSKQTLEDKLGTPVYSFAYPYGDYNADSIRAVQEAGYRYGVTTKPGVNRSLEQPFTLMRIPMFGYRFSHHLQNYLTLRKYRHGDTP